MALYVTCLLAPLADTLKFVHSVMKAKVKLLSSSDCAGKAEAEWSGLKPMKVPLPEWDMVSRVSETPK